MLKKYKNFPIFFLGGVDVTNTVEDGL